MARLRSYVVRFDSGFAPNPFNGYCTLATCKPDIRKAAQIGDWVVGSGSNDKTVLRGGYLVYAMRVSEAMTFQEYDADPRFQKKKPYRRGSRKQSCGDNIYYRDTKTTAWLQRDSFHSQVSGACHDEHVAIDTAVDRVLIGEDFVYFGGEGPMFPDDLQDRDGRSLCKSGIGHSCFDDPKVIAAFEHWLRDLGVEGYQGAPFEWLSLRA